MTDVTPLESEVQRSGRAILEALGWHVFRRNVGVMRVGSRVIRFAERGAADTYGILPDGRHFELEFKRFGERPTKTQVLWLVKTNGIGGSVSFWVDSTAVLERMARAVMEGCRVVYDGWTGDYHLEE
jgi:hypothetical protein